MDYDFSTVVGHGLTDFDSVLAALQCQIDPARLADTDRTMIEHGVLESDRYAALKLLMSAGADPARFGWTEIFLALAFGSLDDLEETLTGRRDLETVDHQRRTAFLFSIQVGDIEKAKLLLNAGADILAIGQDGETAFGYAIMADNVRMLDWLMHQGFDPDAQNADGDTAVYTASAHGAVDCLRRLIAAGANTEKSGHSNVPPLRAATDRDVIELLLDAGADPDDLDPEQLASLLGYKTDEPPACSLEDYLQFSSRAFGRSNPERFHNPFWTAMVHCGGAASLAESSYAAQARALRKTKAAATPAKPKQTWNDPRRPSGTETVFDGGYPVWCYQRFGKSLNRLPDGRFIEIAGEHEDFYDLNFCIYNDIIVHDGRGHCDIYGYPREVFPPTDFHTATLVGDVIYIIGNLGYPEDRRPGLTPVYRLNIHSFDIEQVKTSGDMPGWISRHTARYDGQAKIGISGGRCSIWNEGRHELVDNHGHFELDLTTLNWTRRG